MMERNTELFFAVADAIEREPQRYDQGYYFSDGYCGTTACIAGWAVAIAEYQDDLHEAWRKCSLVDDVAAHVLGLTDEDAVELFFYKWRPHDGLSVSDALRKIGEGASIEDVSAP